MKTLLSILLVAFCITAQAQITSTFDTDADGWTFLNSTVTLTPNHSASGGNPAGFVSATYSSNISFSTQNWIAPAKFIGNQVVRSMGMNLRFDIQQSQAGTNSNINGDVRIQSGGTVIVYSLPTKPAIAPLWTSYSLKLDETQGWRVNTTTGTLATRIQIIEALSGITSLEIRGTYAINAAYTSGLDNVVLEQRTLSPAPTIASLSTTSAEPGTSITITGNNFGTTIANNGVYFGSVAGTITAATTTQLIVTVPLGAQYGKLVVINKTTALYKQSDKPFIPTFTGGGRIIPASFDPPINLPVGSGSGGAGSDDFLSAGDMDGDGWIDLISNDAGNTLLVYRNLGAGGDLTTSSFASKFTLTGAGNRVATKAIDLDGDGKLDIATGYYTDDFNTGFATYRNISTPGNLAFEPVEKWEGLVYSAILSAVVDVDGDGRADLIGRGTSGSVAVDFWIAQNISSPGNIEFGASTSYFGNAINGVNPVTAADLDNDGKPEMIIVSGDIYIAKNNSTPGVISFDTPFEIDGVATFYGAVQVADFNLDGKNDLAWKKGFSNDDVRIRINTNIGGPLAAADFSTEIILDSELSFYGGLTISDVNGDGKPDIIATDNADVGVFENNYLGGVFDANAFGSAHQLQGFDGTTTPLVADLNGDKKPELILYHVAGTNLISIYENKNIHAPVISVNTVSPLKGTVGSTVTITGNNFSTTPAENLVWFGGVKATVLTASENLLTVAVPAGATYAPVSVTKNGLTSRYHLPFQTTFGAGVSFNNTHFAPPVNFTLTGAGYNIEAGDLNIDGRIDILASAGNVAYAFRNDYITGAITTTTLIANDTLSPTTDLFGNPRLEDFDGDGYLDVASVNARVRKNITTGSNINFSPNITYTGQGNLAYADFNQDGKMDIAVSNSFGAQLNLFENRTVPGNFTTTGTYGSFSSVFAFAKPGTGGEVVAADFDADGFPDVITVNITTDNISIFRNVGGIRITTVQFAARVDIAVGDMPNRVYKGDFDSDGKLDLMLYHAAGTSSTLLIVLHNTSTAGNISFSRIDLTNPSATTVATIADLDGDGKPEIITTSESGNRFSIFKNIHTSGVLTAASFEAPFNTTVTAPRGITTGDLNLDGKPEIILTRAAGLLVVYENLIPSIPPPTITSFTPTSGPIGTAVTINGTNFDTTPINNIVYFGATRALVTAATATQLTVTVPTGATYQPITVQVGGLTAYSSRPFVVTFAGGGAIDNCSFAPATSVGTVGTLARSALFDVDGDGKTDLVIPDRTGSNNQVAVFRNTSTAGTSSFASVLNVTGLNDPVSVALGDVDGDGNPDMAVVNYTNGKLSVFKNLSTTGTISFAPKVDFTIPSFSDDVTIADVDGDGKQDLTVITSLNGLIVFRNTGTPGVINASTFAAGVTFTTGPNAFPAVLGDIDGDGKLDAAVPNANAYTVSLLRNTSTPGVISFATQTLTIAAGTPSLGLGAGITLLGDIDGDTKLDLLVTVNTFNTVSIYRNTSTTGSISFDPKFDIAFPSTSYTPAISDLDGDGKIDLAIDRNATGLSIYKNTATSGVINASSFAPPVLLTRSASGMNHSGDIDGDGRNDIISTSTNVQVFRNLVGTISVPTITSFSPTSGLVGTSVTITGTNFGTLFSKTVEFNGTSATITGSTANTLTVTVPVGATTGPVSVTIGCNTITGSNFTIGSPATITITTQPSDFIACVGQTATFTTAAAGTTNIGYQWQFSTTLAGTYNDIANGSAYSNVTTTSLSINTTGNFGAGFYRCKVDGDFAATVFSNASELIVNDVPAIPTMGTVNLGCAPASTTLNPTGASAGEAYKFFDAASGGIALGSGLSFTTPSLSISTTYYVSTYNTTTLCESARVPVGVTIQSCSPPVVLNSTTTAFIEGIVTIDLEPLISDEDNNLDLSTLQIISQPESGAPASLDNFLLTIDYSGVPFPGTDNVEIEICDLTGICAQQELTIELEGEIEIFNALSPNGDGKNETFIIQYINVLPETQPNKVTIYNRWGDVVWEGSDYDNSTVVFEGINTNGKELPSGTYFYKIDFISNLDSQAGFLSLKR